MDLTRLVWMAVWARLWDRPDGVELHLHAKWPGETSMIVETAHHLVAVNILSRWPKPQTIWDSLDRAARECQADDRAIERHRANSYRIDLTKVGRDQ